MINRYSITEVEQRGLLSQVLGEKFNIENMQLISPNIFYTSEAEIPIIIKFTDYDCSVGLAFDKTQNTEIDNVINFIKQNHLFLSECSKQLCETMRQYKHDKFGKQYIEDYNKYADFLKLSDGNSDIAEALSYVTRIENNNKPIFEPEKE